MDAAQAIADLREISPQVQDVVVIAPDGAVQGSNASEQRAAHLAEAAQRLLAEAEQVQPNVTQLEAATVQGSVFVVRDAGRVIAATTTPEPTVGLVFYDLKTCLRSVDEPKKAARRARKPKADAAS